MASQPKKQKAKPSTNVRPEAELESRLATALAAAFPNIDRSLLTEQRRFTVRLGHETHEFDSAALWEKNGRADILIFHNQRPLAVLEIKREDLALTQADYEQAQSYANQLTPRPPLVIVTNGGETRVYDGNTGQPWSGEQDSAAAVSRLLVNAAQLAAADMRWATEALMGRETGVWVPIVRSSTARLLAEMTDAPGESGSPFAQHLLFPRLATLAATKALQAATSCVIVEGVPQAGKSSLLRELALRTRDSTDLAVLMLRGGGPGLFQSLANLFAAELEWNLTANDARQWLRRMSSGSEGPSLVVAIDGVDPGSAMAADLQELASLRPGRKLNVILTTDRAERLTKAVNGRTKTALGVHAEVIELGSLVLEEFRAAQRAMRGNRISFPKGAEYAEDYRSPWVLRSIYDDVASHPRYQDPSFGVLLSAAPGIELIDAARKIYSQHPDLLRGYRVLSRCAVSDEGARSTEFALAAANGFVIRQDAISAEARDALTKLKETDAVRTYRHSSGDDVIVPTVPVAFMMELAAAVGEELAQRVEIDPHDAGVWLGRRLGAVFLGDVVGAQAIRFMAEKTGGFSFGLIEGLLSIEPSEELLENALFVSAAPDGRLIYLKIEDGKVWYANRYGETNGEPIDLGTEQPRTHSNTAAWMILGQLARSPAAVLGDDSRRIDAELLLMIGQCPFPLLRANVEGLGHLEHDLGVHGQVLCPKQGPIEATTQAMADLLSRPWADADDWVEAAIDTGSLPLLHRVLIALRTVCLRNIPDLSDWAESAARDRVSPSIAAALSQPEN
ncbi:type I restriction endonuclease [Ralstonia solanacearum]|uniref:type I restriction endonuclease n=1 Tax=Ralstonia solanacearum TaxID=305 RepID=UPI0018D0F88C|nr:type I restriction endonuclease [Ralstonia solanacearum]